jgi:hypothetical protein
MGSTLRYLAVDGEDSAILDWFDHLDAPPRRVPVERGSVLYFRELGPLVHDGAGRIDSAASPVATVIPARSVRSILWTAGEVHFLATPLRSRFPGLDRIRRQFGNWLGQFNPVYQGRPGDWDYNLEGSIRNYDSAVYAMPGAMAALERGTYFVADDDNDIFLDKLCRRVALRGVTCDERSSAGAIRGP